MLDQAEGIPKTVPRIFRSKKTGRKGNGKFKETQSHRFKGKFQLHPLEMGTVSHYSGERKKAGC